LGRHRGWRPRPAFAGFRTYQFSTRELARLLLLRGDVLEARLGQGRLVGDLAPCP